MTLDYDDARRLVKILDVLVKVDEHLMSKDKMNAALHLSEEIRPTPLASAVHGSRRDLEQFLGEG